MKNSKKIENKNKKGISRRTLIKSSLAGGIAASTLGFPAISYGGKKMTITTAYFKTYPGHAPEAYILKHKLFARYAEKFGYNITAKHVQAQTGVAALEGVLAGELDWTHHGESPLATIISNGLPVHCGSPGDGGYGNTLMVRPDSKIGTLDDLVEKRARIALRMASGQHGFCDALFRAAYGKGPEELGIEMVDMSPSEAMLFPKGLDAVVSHAVIPYLMLAKGVCKFLVNNEGEPGPAWKGGIGSDGKVDFFKKANGYPEGFILYRGYNSYRKELVEEHPNLYISYMLACAEALKAFDQTTLEGQKKAFEHGKDFWDVPPDHVRLQFAKSIAMKHRRWAWITEGDLKACVWGAPMLYKAGRIRKPVKWDMVKKYFSATAPLEKKAWEMINRFPTVAEMTRKDVADMRGYPTWEMDKWEAKDVV